jgi:hypothetical protein
MVMDSSGVAALVSAGATCVTALAAVGYAVLFAATLKPLKRQLDHMRQGTTLTAAMAVLQELRANEAYESRKYLINTLPASPEGLEEGEIQAHFDGIHQAVTTLHTVGFLIKAGDVDERLRDHIMTFVWATAWRCWNKSEKFIQYEAARRNDKDYMSYFKALYEMSEDHRKRNSLPEIK